MERAVTRLLPLLIAGGLAAGCAAAPESAVRIARLGSPGGDPEGFEALRSAFQERNEGYALQHFAGTRRLAAEAWPRVVFVQAGEGRVTVARGQPDASSDAAVGDVVLLRAGETLAADAELDLVVFTVPDDLPGSLPTFVRPDWDPRITNTPGGCATETGAYRRILLTWLETNGPYVFHALNAHRVRITDSFSHYHPIEGGFDEFYLVQMVQPDARLLTSERVDAIESGDLTAAEAAELLDEHALAVGDLVYLPRGVVHRGLGGVLAQVITAPGFRPGAEIGVDHHLREINARLGLAGDDALPFHAAASVEAVVK